MKKGLNQTCYGLFSCLANPTRLATLERLTEGAMNVSQISRDLNQEQSMISHNLRPLIRCGLIRIENKGKERICYLNSETFNSLINVVENHAKKHCPTGGTCKR